MSDDELKAELEKAGLEVPLAELERLVNVFDKDNNNNLDFVQFLSPGRRWY